MNIIGNGVDIVDNKRILKAIKNENFINRIFSKEEIYLSKNYKNKVNYFAKRFAAKEAFLKAIGTGLRGGTKFKEISVINNHLGKPSLNISNKITSIIRKKFRIKNFYIHVSLSDEKKHSIAFVILNTR